MSRKARVEYVQNSEPAFIRQFKQRAGIPISDTVDSKRSQLPHDDGDHGDRPDEQPQLVLDEFSGVTESEARAFLADCAIKEKAKVDPKNDGSSELSSVADFVGPRMLESSPTRIVFRPSSERTTNRHDSESHRKKPDGTHVIREASDERDRSPLRANKPSGGFLSFDPDEDDE